ncbi:unnamed protein product [Amaranthus hypochondriacus]
MKGDKRSNLPTVDISSPYFLSSGDQPSNMITHILLTGDNYTTWARAITLSLKVRRKFVFIDGMITKPTEEVKLLDWVTVNSMLVAWILRNIEPNFRFQSLFMMREENYGNI